MKKIFYIQCIKNLGEMMNKYEVGQKLYAVYNNKVEVVTVLEVKQNLYLVRFPVSKMNNNLRTVTHGMLEAFYSTSLEEAKAKKIKVLKHKMTEHRKQIKKIQNLSEDEDA